MKKKEKVEKKRKKERKGKGKRFAVCACNVCRMRTVKIIGEVDGSGQRRRENS